MAIDPDVATELDGLRLQVGTLTARLNQLSSQPVDATVIADFQAAISEIHAELDSLRSAYNAHTHTYGDSQVDVDPPEAPETPTQPSPEPPGPTPLPDPPPASPPGEFVVSGPDIFKDGQLFRPFGANVAVSFTDFPYVFEGGDGGVNSYQRNGQTIGHKAAAMSNWGWNALRINVVPFGDNNTPNMDQTVAGVGAGILELASLGFVCIVELHHLTGSDPVWRDNKSEIAVDFFNKLLGVVGHLPNVWLNPINEPFQRSDVSGWIAYHNELYDTMRTQGWDQPIIVDLPRWGQGIDSLANGSLDSFAVGKENLIFGHHAYGAATNSGGSASEHMDLWQEVADRGHCVYIGELGVANPVERGNAGPPEWNVTGFYAAADAIESGLVSGGAWWNGTGDDSNSRLYSLASDNTVPFWEATNLTAAGQRWYDLGQIISN